MTLPVTYGYGTNHLAVTYGYGRETLIGGTKITQLYREADFEFDVSFVLKKESELSLSADVSIHSGELFKLISSVDKSAKDEFLINPLIRLTQESIYSIESKTRKEISYSFDITSNLSHKRLIMMLKALD